jgi:(S)-sulfolactate dehydrogenase
VSADVLCLRPEADFHEVGVQPPGDLRIRFAAGPDAVPDEDLATARAVVLASVGPALERSWADRAGRVELVQFTGAGVDRAAAAFTGRPGVTVANVPAANAREVAEYVLLATGNLLRGLALADREIRAGRYREVRGRLTPAAVRSLHSATVGVVGLGQIGLAVARLFRAAGAQVGYSDPAPRDPAAADELGLSRLDLGGLLAGSDVVTLHVPLMAATRGLIGEPELRQMRPGAILVNASRGGVVDEAALAAALEDGHLGGAVLDVYTREPPPAGSPLLSLPASAADRVLYTPHIAGVAYEAARRLYTEAWANVRRVLVDGLPPENSATGAGPREQPAPILSPPAQDPPSRPC